jgi:hypothetical protein
LANADKSSGAKLEVAKCETHKGRTIIVSLILIQSLILVILVIFFGWSMGRQG